MLIAPYLLYKIKMLSSLKEVNQLLFSQNYIYALLFILFSTTALISVRLFFYKTNSIEIFFFMLFLASIVFDSSRAIIIIIQQFNPPISYIKFFSKAAYFGRIFGTLTIFASALSSSDIGIKKLDIPVIIITAISFLFASSMTFSDVILKNNYFMPCSLNYFRFSIAAIKLLAIIIFIINFFQKKNSGYFFLALSILLITAGRELSFYGTKINYFIPGFILIILGTILFANRLHEIYKW
jgi:hypothetical protein